MGELAEFGCGTGYFTETIIQKANHLVATDLSDELLEVARQRFNQNPNITFQKENCMASSFTSEKFDSVFMANLIHVVENPIKVLQECHRILKNGGMLIIVTFTNYGMNLKEKIKLGIRFLKTWGKPPQHTHAFSPEKLASLMEDSGFTIDKSKLIGYKTKALYLVGKKS
ncbi:MAG: class I SAM-dependent methyltransferase [Desulfobacterales bacterium]|nr:MAG: class I SAM-dependent methyltransferase [Desulfobacterales bacterium]